MIKEDLATISKASCPEARKSRRCWRRRRWIRRNGCADENPACLCLPACTTKDPGGLHWTQGDGKRGAWNKHVKSAAIIQIGVSHSTRLSSHDPSWRDRVARCVCGIKVQEVSSVGFPSIVHTAIRGLPPTFVFLVDATLPRRAVDPCDAHKADCC